MPGDGLSDEDKALFQNALQNVKPLDHTKKRAIRPSPRPYQQKSHDRTFHTKPVSNYHLSDHAPEIVLAESTLTYCQHCIPHRRFLQLKKGQIPWQARLDLHGLRQNAARDSLCHFVEEQSQLSNRCLLIIHGKGSPNGEPPILKNLVNHWLQQLPQILAFHSALARDGGNGAIYVLLKR